MRGAGSPRVTHPFAARIPPKGLSARLACVKHAASVHPEPGSNSPLKLSRQTEVCDSRRISDLAGPVRSTYHGQRRPGGLDRLPKSYRFGLLTDPLGLTGFMRSDLRTLLASITVSGFQGSGAARGYITGLAPRCQQAVLTDFRADPHVPRSVKNASGIGGVGWAGDRRSRRVTLSD